MISDNKCYVKEGSEERHAGIIASGEGRGDWIEKERREEEEEKRRKGE